MWLAVVALAANIEEYGTIDQRINHALPNTDPLQNGVAFILLTKRKLRRGLRRPIVIGGALFTYIDRRQRPLNKSHSSCQSAAWPSFFSWWKTSSVILQLNQTNHNSSIHPFSAQVCVPPDLHQHPQTCSGLAGLSRSTQHKV